MADFRGLLMFVKSLI